MKKIVLFVLMLFWFAGAANAATPDVLAHSCGEWSWYAHVQKVPGIVPTDQPGSNEQTECFALQHTPGQQWRAMPVVPGRAVAMAARSSQLVLLMADGQWMTLWADGSAPGQPLPAQGQIKAITDDGADLWAIGSVNGGLAEATRAVAADSSTTQASTAPIAIALDLSTATERLLHTVPSHLVLFHQQQGRWAAVAELPPDARMASDSEISLAVVGGEAMVSFVASTGGLRTMQFSSAGTWKEAGWLPTAATGSPASFGVLTDGFKPLLWMTSGNMPGRIFPNLLSPGSGFNLAWDGKEALDGVPAAAFAGGYLCVFGPHAGKVFEQRYKTDGSPVETAAELVIASDLNDTLLPRWIELVLLTSMGFSVGASVFRQWTEPQRPIRESPVAAPILPRLAAGLLDALPVIGVLFYIGVETEALNNVDRIPFVHMILLLASAALVYVLHTTIVESITGRSAGKWVFGLKVVTLTGEPASRQQLVIRNLLRVIDPLVMIIISPQRQRSADAVAATMVVPLEPIERNNDEMDEF